ncbi:unnamed protein product [Urochloa decumbens]|uniref:Uncharacterized protein n=1 Tax=Urochloa decumbens TaxID=240449 RepID=A0ABC9H477_9POAL
MEFATGALGTLLPKLGQLLQDEYNLHKGAKKNIEFLTRELESTQAALRSVGELPPEQLSELVRIWARDARELSYDMEDIVDTFLVRVQGPGPQSKKGSKRFIKKMKDFVNKAKTRHDIGQDIEDIKERVKEVAERRERYMANAITPTQTFIDPRITALYTKAADLVGIDEAREELIIRLTKGDDISAQQRIVSVIGFGGLGKTTLAKAVYEKIKGQFDSVAFVPVGRSPDLKKVFKDILINLDKQKYMHFNFAILDERHIIDEFQEFLENKRYFIVIDDIWEARSWEIIKLALVENNSGSRIIITTRKHEVAREAGGVVYKLQPLSDENSRKLFFTRIVGGESKSPNHQPDDDLSDKILRKCGGIPLTIITMASVLVSKPRNEWTEVLRSIGFANKGNRQVENTMKILSFSYYDLPSHLRTCLLHLSVFPEDYFIEKRPLIWMWIAEGFVQEKQGIFSFEIGEGYFNELVNRSMIQPREEWEGDDVVCGCEVHDMVLDLIRSISCEENFVTMLDNNNSEGVPPLLSIHGRVRRLALQNNRVVEVQTKDLQQLRSLVSYGCDPDKGVPLSRFKLIRVLAIDTSQCMESCHIEHLQNLLHLRYLRLSGKEVVLPEELVGTLKFLQTLDVEGLGMNTEVVLKSAGLQTQLLCLRFRGACRVLIDGGIGRLTSLKELQMFYYQQEEEPLRRFVKELGRLRELRVLRLRIPDLLPTDVQIDMLESLRSMEKMEHLSLIMLFLVYADTTMWQAAEFRLPRNLRKLVLRL